VGVRLLVDAAEFWPVFAEDAKSATSRCYVQTLTFEADRAGRGLADLLLALPSTVDRRLILDDFSHYLHNDRLLYTPSALRDAGLWREARDSWALVRSLAHHGVSVRWTNKMHGRLYRLTNRNHKKILVIDDRVAYIGGVNFTDHNFGWHDLMLRIDDPDMVAWLADDILATFAGRNQGVSRRFRDGQLTLLDGKHGWPLQQQLFDQIASARQEVVVISSYASEPYFDPLEEAARRGARVMILTPAVTNWGWFDAYTRIECKRRGFELYRLPWRMSHMKALLIDSKRLVVGSSNFDYFGHLTHQELLFETTDDGLIRDFRKRIFEKDVALASRHVPAGRFPWQDRLVRFLLRTGFFLTPKFNRVF